MHGLSKRLKFPGSPRVIPARGAGKRAGVKPAPAQGSKRFPVRANNGRPKRRPLLWRAVWNGESGSRAPRHWNQFKGWKRVTQFAVALLGECAFSAETFRAGAKWTFLIRVSGDIENLPKMRLGGS